MCVCVRERERTFKFYSLSKCHHTVSVINDSHHDKHQIFRSDLSLSCSWNFMPFCKTFSIFRTLPPYPCHLQNHSSTLFLWVWHFWRFHSNCLCRQDPTKYICLGSHTSKCWTHHSLAGSCLRPLFTVSIVTISITKRKKLKVHRG